MSGIEEHVRVRAYELWQLAGAPEGRGDEFWFAAENEFEYGDSEFDTEAFEGEASTLIPKVDEPPTAMS